MMQIIMAGMHTLYKYPETKYWSGSGAGIGGGSSACEFLIGEFYRQKGMIVLYGIHSCIFIERSGQFQ